MHGPPNVKFECQIMTMMMMITVIMIGTHKSSLMSLVALTGNCERRHFTAGMPNSIAGCRKQASKPSRE